MHLKVKLVTNRHPRGLDLELDVREGLRVGELMDELLLREEMRGCTREIYKGLLLTRNGSTVAETAELKDGDRLSIRKVMTGG